MLADEQPEGNLRATLVVSQQEARSGTTRLITLPGGERIPIAIPPDTSDGFQVWLENPTPNITETVILTIAITPTTNLEPQHYQHNDNISASGFYGSPDQMTRLPDVMSTKSSFTSIADQPTDKLYPPLFPSYYQTRGGRRMGPTTRRPPLTVILLLIALALLLTISSYLVYKEIYQPGHLSDQATSATQAQIAGTAHVAATATAHIAATSQAQVQATATVVDTFQTSYDQITRSSPVLIDPLTAVDSNSWDTGPGCIFTDGAYHAISNQKGLITPCFAQSTHFSDFAYQVQLSILKGNYGGVIFRADVANTKLYLFRIAQDGSYNLDYYPDSTGNKTKILAGGSSDLILTGPNAANQITIIARGGSISLYINGKYLTSVNDTAQSAGQIGVIADDTADATEVVYSQAQVWSI